MTKGSCAVSVTSEERNMQGQEQSQYKWNLKGETMVYVMSDIHGNMRRFHSIMDQIHLQPDDTLYILGDVIDRHPDGIQILQEIMDMPNAQMLLGNHEYMMLNVVAPMDGIMLYYSPRKRWYDNHGQVTHRSFNKLSEEKRREIVRYLRSLPLNIDIEVKGIKYKLVHASPVEFYQDFSFDSEAEFAVWYRLPDRIEEKTDYVLIHGHTPTAYYQDGSPLRIWHDGSNRIDIDCGSGFEDGFAKGKTYYPEGRLACLRLDDMAEFYSEEV